MHLVRLMGISLQKNEYRALQDNLMWNKMQLRMKEEPVKQIIERAMHGDADAFVQLMENNAQSMYKTARGFFRNEEDIADVIQDTILTCYEKLDTLRRPEFFKTWMIRILINHCNDLIRKNRKTLTMSELPEREDRQKQSELMESEFTMLIDSLDEKYRLVILLYYLEQLKIPEIAKVLDMNENTVKTRLKRGREELKQILI